MRSAFPQNKQQFWAFWRSTWVYIAFEQQATTQTTFLQIVYTSWSYTPTVQILQIRLYYIFLLGHFPRTSIEKKWLFGIFSLEHLFHMPACGRLRVASSGCSAPTLEARGERDLSKRSRRKVVLKSARDTSIIWRMDACFSSAGLDSIQWPYRSMTEGQLGFEVHLPRYLSTSVNSSAHSMFFGSKCWPPPFSSIHKILQRPRWSQVWLGVATFPNAHIFSACAAIDLVLRMDSTQGAINPQRRWSVAPPGWTAKPPRCPKCHRLAPPGWISRLFETENWKTSKMYAVWIWLVKKTLSHWTV